MDHMLTFNAHIDEVCKKAGQKMNALSRLITIYEYYQMAHSFKQILYFAV